MLLPIDSQTQRGAIFSALNQELLFFLDKACDADDFDRNLFSPQLGAAIWANEPTTETFRGLWNEFKRLSKTGRRKCISALQQCQDLSAYYSDTTQDPATISKRLSKAIHAVAVHLFSRTSKLQQVEAHCGETLTQFFAHFCARNKNVCCVCGTDVLAQYRADVDDADQWRGPFDHIFAKEHYPIFAIHPDNLIPICWTCNSKAKLSKDILHGSSGVRRQCFNPYTESAHEMVGVKLLQSNTSLIARSFFRSPNSSAGEKLKTWDDVYCIRKRVDGWFLTLLVLIDTDCCAKDLESLKARIEEKKDAYLTHARNAPWNFWKHKLYSWLHTESPDHIDLIWTALEAHRDDPSFAQEFGI